MKNRIFKIAFAAGIALVYLAGAGTPAYAQDVEKVQSLRNALARYQLEQSQVGGTAIPADVLRNAFSPDETGDPLKPGDCSKRPRKNLTPSRLENGSTEILLVMEGNFGPSRIPGKAAEHPYVLTAKDVKSLQQMGLVAGGGMPLGGMGQVASSINSSLGAGSAFSRSVIVENILQIASVTRGTEDALADQIARQIQEAAGNDPAELNALMATLNDRFYTVYNKQLNPGQNNGALDVNDFSSIPLSRWVNSVVNWSPDETGVCSNVGAVYMKIGSKVYRDADPVLFNNGSHFAVSFQDRKKKKTVFNWDEVKDGGSELSISPNLPATNTRVYKLVDGKVREVAVLKTERGQVFDKILGQSGDALKTGREPSVIYAEILKGRMREKLGYAQTSSSQMVVITAQRDGKYSSVSLGAGVEKMKTAGNNQNVIVNATYQYDRPVVRYQSPRVKLELRAGALAEASYGVKLSGGDVSMDGIPAYSVNGQLRQELRVETTPKSARGAQAGLQVSTIQAIGVRDLEAFQANISQQGMKGITGAAKQLGFGFQQFDAQGSLRVPLSPNVNLNTQASAQLSNLSLDRSLETGVEIQTSGATVYTYVGYTNADSPGRLSSVSYSPKITGLTTNSGVRTANGTTLELKTGGNFQQGQLKLGLPIRTRKNR